MRARLLGLLSRETSTGRFVPQIDGLRFVAIAAVLLSHISDVTKMRSPVSFVPTFWDDLVRSLCSQGSAGVQLFFAISGFVLGIPFASNRLAGTRPVPLSQYFLRRVTRLEPPYIICLTIGLALWVVVRHVPFRELLPNYFASVFYVHNIVYDAHSRITGVAWSLEIEVQFYILTPLLAMVFAVPSRIWRRAILALFIVGFSAAQLVPPLNHAEGFGGLTLFHQLHYFLVGFLLADLYLTDWKNPPTHRLAWDVVSTLAWAGMLALFAIRPHNDPEQRLSPVHVAFPVLIFLAYAGAFRGSLWWRVFSTPILYTIGGMCYTIYLFHMYMQNALAPFTLRLAFTQSLAINTFLQVLLLFPAYIALSAALFVVIEKPFMRKDWPQRTAAFIRALFARGTKPGESGETPVQNPSSNSAVPAAMIEAKDLSREPAGRAG